MKTLLTLLLVAVMGLAASSDVGAVQKTCSLKWNAVSGATGYRVQHGATSIDVGNVTQIQLFAVGIEVPATYSVAVTAYNSGGDGIASAATSVTIDPPVVAPGQVTGVVVQCP